MKKKIYYLIFSLVFICGCATYTPIRELPKEEQEKITTRIYDYKYDTVFEAIVSVCFDSNFVIEKMDKESGLITTEWITESALDAAMRQAVLGIGQQRARWNFRIMEIDKQKTKVKAYFFREFKTEFGWEKVEPTNHEYYISGFEKTFDSFERYCEKE